MKNLTKYFKMLYTTGMAAKNKVGAKIAKIMKEGIRQNTKKPVSKSNKRHPVSQKQAVAVALSMARKGKVK